LPQCTSVKLQRKVNGNKLSFKDPDAQSDDEEEEKASDSEAEGEETNAPTTVLTNAPTTVLTNAPTTVLTNAPTTVLPDGHVLPDGSEIVEEEDGQVHHVPAPNGQDSLVLPDTHVQPDNIIPIVHHEGENVVPPPHVIAHGSMPLDTAEAEGLGRAQVLETMGAFSKTPAVIASAPISGLTAIGLMVVGSALLATLVVLRRASTQDPKNYTPASQHELAGQEEE